MMESKVFVATKAFIEHNGKVLIVRESAKYEGGTNIGKFDVPGGKLRAGEIVQEALQREVNEETGLKVTIGQPFYVGQWSPEIDGEVWHIIGIFFRCQAATDQVQLGIDHDLSEWVDPSDFRDYMLIPNLIPAFQAYLNQV